MIICSALYFPGDLSNPTSLVRDNRFYPGKAASTFPVWWAYVRRHYPDVPVVLFEDEQSPVKIDRASIGEPYRLSCQAGSAQMQGVDPKVTFVTLTEHCGKYFWPMQRNLVEAIILAYRLHEDLFWLDSDAFLNTDIRPLVRGADAAAPSIARHQMTMDSVCTYISARRLHALDHFGVDLPAFLTTLLNEGPTETRMHTFQEGGLYKLFGWGDARVIGDRINLTHLSCYTRFMRFLERNPLDTPEYHALVAALPAAAERARAAGAEMEFHDMYHEAP